MHEKVKIRTAKSLVDTRWKFTEAVVQRCSVNKVFLKISQNSQNNTCARNVNKVAGLRPEFRVHKAFRACHESLLTTIYTLKLCPVSRGLIDSQTLLVTKQFAYLIVVLQMSFIGKESLPWWFFFLEQLFPGETLPSRGFSGQVFWIFPRALFPRGIRKMFLPFCDPIQGNKKSKKSFSSFDKFYFEIQKISTLIIKSIFFLCLFCIYCGFTKLTYVNASFMCYFIFNYYWRFSLHASTQPTVQRRINVVSTLWINVEMTLIRR